jgi:hypothetical protein
MLGLRLDIPSGRFFCGLRGLGSRARFFLGGDMPDLTAYEPVITLFLAGRMPNMNHARHLAIANLLRHLPHGRELLHLGLQATAIRAGVPEKYSAAITEFYWDRLDGALPALSEFADVLP